MGSAKDTSKARAWRYSSLDGMFVLLAFAQGTLLLGWPTIGVIGIGMWWCANTISHNFIHLPFFRWRVWNRLFSLYLSLLLGVPQTLWQQRHLAHHAGRNWRLRWTGPLRMEAAVLFGLWSWFLWRAPEFWLGTYVPGLALGLTLCALQGYFEHCRGTTSHYGRGYNLLFFNDGYHVEHHRHPHAHWSSLPELRADTGTASAWPAVLRWLEWLHGRAELPLRQRAQQELRATLITALERWVLRSPRLQRWVLRQHERAFRKLLPDALAVRRAGIVGGGLFPRTALVLKRLNPNVQICIIDSNAENLERARPFLGGDVRLSHGFFDAAHPNGEVTGLDLLVVPLAFVGDRRRLYAQPPAPRVLVHDWLWRPEGRSAIVSVGLLKRLNLVIRCER